MTAFGRREAYLVSVFKGAVRESFEPWLLAEGFLGPEIRDDTVRYLTPILSVAICMDLREGYVLTFTGRLDGEPYRQAELSCLYARAGLGAAQRISWAGRTGHAIRRSLRMQSNALKELLPILGSESGHELVRECRW